MNSTDPVIRPDGVLDEVLLPDPRTWNYHVVDLTGESSSVESRTLDRPLGTTGLRTLVTGALGDGLELPIGALVASERHLSVRMPYDEAPLSYLYTTGCWDMYPPADLLRAHVSPDTAFPGMLVLHFGHASPGSTAWLVLTTHCKAVGPASRVRITAPGLGAAWIQVNATPDVEPAIIPIAAASPPSLPHPFLLTVQPQEGFEYFAFESGTFTLI